MSNKTSFVAVNLTIGISFDTVYPFAADDLSVFWSVNYLECIHLYEGHDFVFHGLPPLVLAWQNRSFLVCRWFISGNEVDVQFDFGFICMVKVD